MTMPPAGQWPPAPQGPPQYWGPPPPPPKGGGKAKWVLGGLVILVVVVLTVVGTLLVTRGEPGAKTNIQSDQVQPSSSDPPSGGRPITVIASEPTCAEWIPVNDALAAAENNGWLQRDPSLPASAWRADQRAQYRAVGDALRSAADQTVVLARRTPNRSVRTLYEQFIAYARAYADSIPLLQATDDHLVRVTVGLSLAITSICNSITYKSAESRAALVPAREAVRDPGSVQNPDLATKFLTAVSPECAQVSSAIDRLSDATATWQTISPDIPATNWSPEQRSANQAAMGAMEAFSADMQNIGEQSSNSELAYFAQLAAQYRLVFAAAIPTYVPADNYLNEVATGIAGAMHEACLAVGT